MEETISLKEIFGVIKKRLLLILALVFGAALIAAAVSYFVLTPTYESSSQFIVNQGQQDPEVQYNVNDIRANVEIINTYNVIIKSPAILDEVVEELNLPYSSSALGDKLQVSNAENSQVVSVTATDENPERAVNIANATVSIFKENITEFMNVDNVSILSEAELSENPTPVAPNPVLNIAIAVVLGAMVGVGLAFLLEYLDNTVTTEDDLEKKHGLPVLGVIAHIDSTDLHGENSAFQGNRMQRSGFDGPQKKSS
ncbi:Capsular polysaccharide type 8 biosynthesis protein cap8A [Oceanobacillus picturae]|uniref:Capsular polysaccharide type 8 biosynthesis protein cap8A n=1 Tax=Oceanobacillus picturae TaxID=171693 RepID=W9ADZ0_9BACI|nr:Wzz/FepE/Etk N-terminal domain-containing protein [Oceanobacillus picturae]CDO03688.1 Capsular polysaccharide type 8 biosynthesis protein cap8A [Oceanobacillus picturae]